MKKTILIIGTLLLSTIGFTQEKFYTNNFTKEIKEINKTIKTVEFTTVLPESYNKYDDIVAVIDSKDEGLNDYYKFDFYYNIIPTKIVAKDRKVKYVIETSTDKKNDFTSLFRVDMNVDFDIFQAATFNRRTFRYQTVAVKIMGRKQEGTHWVNNELVPKFRYEDISFAEIKLDLGEPAPTYTTEKGLFTYKKYNEGKEFTTITAYKGTDNLDIVYNHGEDPRSSVAFDIYEIVSGEIKEESFDMSGEAPKASSGASVDKMIQEIKLNLKKTLIKSSCYNDARSVKLVGQRMSETKISEGIYKPYMLDASKKDKGGNGGSLKSIGGQFTKSNAGNDKYNKFINSADSDLKWETKKLGNATFEVLELDFYHKDQCTEGSESKTLNEGEEGKTQKIFIFLGIVDGRLFAGSFSKDGTLEMNEEDLKFKNFVFSTFKVNK